jgi:hypothetical protein
MLILRENICQYVLNFTNRRSRPHSINYLLEISVTRSPHCLEHTVDEFLIVSEFSFSLCCMIVPSFVGVFVENAGTITFCAFQAWKDTTALLVTTAVSIY